MILGDPDDHVRLHVDEPIGICQGDRHQMVVVRVGFGTVVNDSLDDERCFRKAQSERVEHFESHLDNLFVRHPRDILGLELKLAFQDAIVVVQ